MILSRWAQTAAASGGLRSLTRSSTRTECCPSDQGRFLGRLTLAFQTETALLSERLRRAGVGQALLGETCLRRAVQLLRRGLVLAAFLGETVQGGAVQALAGRLDR